MPSQTSEVAPRWEGYKKTTQAALGWLLDRDPDAWEHLIAICLTALQGLYLPTPDLRIQWENGPLQFERNDYRTKRRLVEGFLPKFFKTYADASEQEILDAAERGEFQRIGYECANAMIDEIRKRTAQKRTGVELSLDVPILDGEDGLVFANLLNDDGEMQPSRGVPPSFAARVRGRIEELGGWSALAAIVGEKRIAALQAALEAVGDLDEGVKDPEALVWRDDGHPVSVFEAAAKRAGISTRQLRRDLERIRTALASMATQKNGGDVRFLGPTAKQY